jgi:hypothetical protein
VEIKSSNSSGASNGHRQEDRQTVLKKQLIPVQESWKRANSLRYDIQRTCESNMGRQRWKQKKHHEDYGGLGCAAVKSGREVPTFRTKLRQASTGQKMETESSSRILVIIYQPTRRHVSEDRNVSSRSSLMTERKCWCWQPRQCAFRSSQQKHGLSKHT